MPKSDKKTEEQWIVERDLMLAKAIMNDSILYRQLRIGDKIQDEFVLQDQNEDVLFVYMSLTSIKQRNGLELNKEMTLVSVSCQDLVASIANGAYREFQKIDLKTKNAQKILRIYQILREICTIKVQVSNFSEKSAFEHEDQE